AVFLDEWAMSDAPWLFGVRRDGTATELRTLQVRPGHSYVLGSSQETTGRESTFPPLATTCEGVMLERIDLPDALSPGLLDQLRKLGLTPTRSVLFWPAGFVPCEWDGESRAQWLSSDQVMLGLMADHPVD